MTGTGDMAPLSSIVSISICTSLFWDLLSWGSRDVYSWIGWLRNGILKPFTKSNIVGSLVMSFQFSRKYLSLPANGTFGISFLQNNCFITGCTSLKSFSRTSAMSIETMLGFCKLTISATFLLEIETPSSRRLRTCAVIAPSWTSVVVVVLTTSGEGNSSPHSPPPFLSLLVFD